MLGFVIGAVSGVVQFWLLVRFTVAATGGKIGRSAILCGLSQFLLPFVVLLIYALFLRSRDRFLWGNLIWAASGIAAALIVSAVIKFVLEMKSEKAAKGGDNDNAR